MTVCMSAISYIGIAPIKALYVILPVLAVFYLVYHSYSTEFFVITVDCGAALGMMWLVHRALVSSNFTWMAYARSDRGGGSDRCADRCRPFRSRQTGQGEEHRQKGRGTLQLQRLP